MNERNFIRGYRWLLLLLAAEYLIIQLSGVGLHEVSGDALFSINADPVAWFPFLLNIPELFLLNRITGWIIDIAFFMVICLMIREPGKQLYGIAGCILGFLFFVTMMSRHIHWNFQEGIFIVLFPLCFSSFKSKSLAFEAMRYFLIFFYASAGILKLQYGAVFHPEHFSHMLPGQFGPYFLEGNLGWRTSLHLYLVNHPIASYLMYLAGTLLELFAIIGFFTKRFDRWIAVAILAFHLADWVIMDIAPFGQLAFICTLFLSYHLYKQEKMDAKNPISGYHFST